MTHVVLLGDSVFDNGPYLDGGPDVLAQLRDRLPRGWRASLLAVDGSRLCDIGRQLRELPDDASHLVISAGGNDALAEAGIFDEPVASVAEALARLGAVRAQFGQDYAAMLDAVAGAGRPVAVCTIYDTDYPEPRRTLAVTGLAVINDIVTRAAFRRGLPLVDLRLVRSEPADFANPIEPSVQGGGKIAAAIAALLQAHDFGQNRSTVFA